MKQTAVEWYFDKIKSHFEHDGDLFEVAQMTYQIAKEKEELQIKIAFEEGSEKEYQHFVNGEERNSFDSKNYYDEKYK
jgi:hypothetical protein